MPRGGRSYYLNDSSAAGGPKIEADVMQCAHCHTFVLPNPVRERERGWCHRCDAYICDLPGCHADCTPKDQMIELALKYPEVDWPYRDQRGFPSFPEELRERHKPYVLNSSGILLDPMAQYRYEAWRQRQKGA